MYRGPISSLIVKPNGFTLITDIEQKVFTLLNVVAQISGVLRLFVSLQTILFGFRPQSPWGLLIDGLLVVFELNLRTSWQIHLNKMGKPVPLLDPVSNRLDYSIYRQNRLGGSGSSSSSNVHVTDEDIDIQDDWKHRMEDRLYLMEHVFKNYYLDDEIFRPLKKAADRNRGDNNNVQVEKNCSVTQNDTLKEDDNNNDINTLVNDIPNSSSLMSRMRNQKLPPDSSNDSTRLISYNEEYK